MNTNRPVLAGTDGFRDIYTTNPGPGKMNAETIAGLSHALVSMQLSKNASNLCVVGRDTRPSGQELLEAAIAGAQKAGAKIINLGVAPTPTILKTAQLLNACSAIAITASHNPAEYNGWKGTIGSSKPTASQAKAISDLYWQQIDNDLDIPISGSQTSDVRTDLIQDYIDLVVQTIQKEFGQLPLDEKMIVFDGANGATAKVTPVVLQKLGAKVETFACNDYGLINDGCGAAELDGLKKFLTEHSELCESPDFIGALANDGDGDRIIGLGAELLKNNLDFAEIEGNRLMELRAQGQPGIVGTDYTNDLMIERLKQQNIGFEFCPNGDVNVTEKLHQLGKLGKSWTRGGEFTGHHIDLGWLESGDGIYIAVWLAAYTASNNTTFAKLAKAMPLWPETMIKVQLDNPKDNLLDQPKVKQQIQLAHQLLGESGRIHLRASGTEKGIYRVWAVGANPDKVNQVANNIADSIKQ